MGGNMRHAAILIVGLICLLFAQLVSHFESSGALTESIGGTLQFILRDKALYAHILDELGIALVIGFVISFTIEKISRREFHAEIEKRIDVVQRQVFRATYQRNIPEGIIEEIEELVFASNFIRKNYVTSYDLESVFVKNLDANDAALPSTYLVRERINSSYQVENITRGERTFVLRFYSETPPHNSLARYCGLEKLEINGKRIPESKITKRQDADISSVSLSITLGPGECISVNLMWSTFKNMEDVELLQSLLPSDGMTLRARFPRNTAVCGAAAIHRSPLVVTDGMTDEGFREWRIEAAVLPHQGIIFWWRSAAE
jgi:hypothetical protein